MPDPRDPEQPDPPPDSRPMRVWHCHYCGASLIQRDTPDSNGCPGRSDGKHIWTFELN